MIIECIKRAREAIWPILERKPTKYKLETDLNELSEKKFNERSIDYAYKVYENQKNRISTIESKSIVFLSFFGVVIGLIAFGIKDLFLKTNMDLVDYTILFLISTITIYITQVLRYSIKALERRGFHIFDASTFIDKNNKEITLGLIDVVKKNYNNINLKVDYMTMAQEFTKRIIWLVAIPAFALCGYTLTYIIKEVNLEGLTNFLKVNHIYIFFVIVFIWLFIISFKLKRKTKKNGQTHL